MTEKFTSGRLVMAVAGRDRGKFYLVLGSAGETMVWVADGTGRKVAQPKKKNMKHLQAYPVLDQEIAGKATTGQRVTDLDVRKALQRLVPAGENGSGSVS